jgi:hypothetical protein
MWKDPIIEEIRNARQAWAEACDFDMQKMYANIAKRQELAKAQGRKFVSFPPRQPSHLTLAYHPSQGTLSG